MATEIDKLIVLQRNFPTIYEIHRNEISQSKNILFTTTDREFAFNLSDRYNKSQVLIEAMEAIDAHTEDTIVANIIKLALDKYNNEITNP